MNRLDRTFTYFRETIVAYPANNRQVAIALSSGEIYSSQPVGCSPSGSAGEERIESTEGRALGRADQIRETLRVLLADGVEADWYQRTLRVLLADGVVPEIGTRIAVAPGHRAVTATIATRRSQTSKFSYLKKYHPMDEIMQLSPAVR